MPGWKILAACVSESGYCKVPQLTAWSRFTVDDEALTADERIDVLKIRPIARLGYKDYTSVESVFQMEKRTPEDSMSLGTTE